MYIIFAYMLLLVFLPCLTRLHGLVPRPKQQIPTKTTVAELSALNAHDAIVSKDFLIQAFYDLRGNRSVVFWAYA